MYAREYHLLHTVVLIVSLSLAQLAFVAACSLRTHANAISDLDPALHLVANSPDNADDIVANDSRQRDVAPAAGDGVYV
jgi:hypothetical protein